MLHLLVRVIITVIEVNGTSFRRTDNKGLNIGWFLWTIFFVFLLCFVVAIFDLVHDVETIHDLLTASGNHS